MDLQKLRDVLTAEVAVELGVAEPRDVSAALQRLWDRRGEAHVSLSSEIARIADLEPAAMARVDAEVDRILAWAAEPRAAAPPEATGPTSPVAARVGPPGEELHLRTPTPGRYREFAPVGEGGMGIVYWALDTELNRQVAMKVVRPQAEGGAPRRTPPSPEDIRIPGKNTPASMAFEELKIRFLQEAWITGGMAHPGILPVYEVGQTGAGVPYYTMRFVKGHRSMATELDRLADAPIEDRLELLEPFLKICDTIAYAHSRGVLHRDLKPENIALGEFGEVVVLDWGLSRLESDDDRAASQWQARVQAYRTSRDFQTTIAALGTPGYMSPEAAQGRLGQLTAQSDLYSLGVILFRILTGRLPFEFHTFLEYVRKVSTERPADPRSLDADLPGPLAALVLRCLATEVADRCESAGEIAEDIRSWQAADARQRESQQLLQEARAHVEAAEVAQGEQALRMLDRATAAVTRANADPSARRAAQRLLAEVGGRRAAAYEERGRIKRRRAIVRVALASLAILTAVSAAALTSINGQRRIAEAASRKLAAALDESDRQRRAAVGAEERAKAQQALAEQLRERADREARRAARSATEAQHAADVAELQRKRADDLRRQAAQKAADARRAAEAADRERRVSDQLRAKADREAARAAKKAAEAKAQAERSRALALSAASQRLEMTAPDLSVKLAWEAVRLRPLPSAVAQLRSVLTRPYIKYRWPRLPEGTISVLDAGGTHVVYSVFNWGQHDSKVRYFVRSFEGRDEKLLAEDGPGTPSYSGIRVATATRTGRFAVHTSVPSEIRVFDAKGDELFRLPTKDMGARIPQSLQTSNAGTSGPGDVTFSSDGTHLLHAGSEGLRLWDLRRHKPTMVLQADDGHLPFARFVGDEAKLLVAAEDGLRVVGFQGNILGHVNLPWCHGMGCRAPVAHLAKIRDHGWWVVASSPDVTSSVFTLEGRLLAEGIRGEYVATTADGAGLLFGLADSAVSEVPAEWILQGGALLRRPLVPDFVFEPDP
jgi:serine/threonine protein kinase